jgi:tripartite-type tricarboxylate transporter receptor subunit TctC
VNDLLAGVVQVMFNNPTQSIPYVKAGKLRALATTGPQRSKQMPELPTVAELGYPGFDVGTWFGVWAPAGTPKPVIEKINAALVKISAMPDVIAKLDEQGLNVIGSTAAELETYQKAESERWGKVVKDAKIEPN